MTMSARKTARRLHAERPAETYAASGGLVGLMAAIAAHDALAAAVAAVGLVPAAVTYLKRNGGLRGIARALLGPPA